MDWLGASVHMIREMAEKALRYSIVTVIGYIGLLKFTSYEAEGIRPFVEHNPLMSWLYSTFSIQQASELIGAYEIASASLIALGSRSDKAGLLGGGMATLMSLTTLSCLFTTPGIWHEERGFPYMSASPGQFVLKDLILLGASLQIISESLSDDSDE